MTFVFTGKINQRIFKLNKEKKYHDLFPDYSNGCELEIDHDTE